MVSIGERLRDERQRLDMSQTALAQVGGVTKKTQMLYESSARSPDAAYLAALSAVGVDVLYVLTGVRGGVVLTPRETALVGNYRGLRPDDQDAAQTLLDSLAKSPAVKKKG